MAYIPEGFASASIVMSHTQLARDAVCTLGVDLQATVDPPSKVANRIHEAWAENIMGALSNQSKLEYVNLYVGNGNAPSGSVRSTLPPEPGDNGGPMVPANTCALVRKNTFGLGRGSRGRMFLPFSISETGVDEAGTVTEAVALALQNRLGLFYDFLVNIQVGYSAVTPPVLFHNSNIGIGGPAPDDILGFSVQTKVGTQRRRIRG